MSYEEIRDEVAAMISEAMYIGVGEIQEDALFSSFGLESMTLARIVGEINRRHGVVIHISDVLHRQTLRQTSQFVFDAINSGKYDNAQ